MTSVADRYRAALPPGECFEFDLRPLDKTGVPTWTASWYATDGGQAHGNGYGTTVEPARIGAYGELAESALGELAVRDLAPRRATYAHLLRERGPGGVADPLTLCLEAGSAYVADRLLHWLPMTRLATGEEVLVPAEFVASAPGEVPGDGLVLPITNGQGAGDTRERAIAHGLLELLQRDTNVVSYRALDRGVMIDLDEVADPEVRAAVETMRAAGIRVLPKLAATDFDMASVFVVGDDTDPPHPLQLTGCGEAVHPDREVALRKAVTEYASSRVRKVLAHAPVDVVRSVAPPAYLERIAPGPQEERALRDMTAWAALPVENLREQLSTTVLAERSRVPLSTLPTVPPGSLADPADLLADLRRRLADFDVLVLDRLSDGVHAVKVVVPRLEAETMSYGRIGERGVARLLARGGDLVGVGAPPPGAAPVLLTDEARDRLGGPAWFHRSRAAALLGPLYPLYREPDRHAVALTGVAA